MSTSAPRDLVAASLIVDLRTRSPKRIHPTTTTATPKISAKMPRHRKNFGGPERPFDAAGSAGGRSAPRSENGAGPSPFRAEPAVDIVYLRRGDGVVQASAAQPLAEGYAIANDEDSRGDEDREPENC